jgi:hypothetical protein
MALPILQIAKLLGQLTVLAPVVTEGAERIRKLVETIRKGDGNAIKELDALKQAIELQSAVNHKVDDQLRLIESVLKNMQRALRVLALACVALGVLSVTALAVAVLK